MGDDRNDIVKAVLKDPLTAYTKAVWGEGESAQLFALIFKE